MRIAIILEARGAWEKTRSNWIEGSWMMERGAGAEGDDHSGVLIIVSALATVITRHTTQA
jgi:hypothetical protein